MIVSEKQQQANRQSAQRSTAPRTSEETAAVRLNALTCGLRARSLLIPREDPEEYKQLWAELVAEWQPQSRTERIHLEQMASSQWLLARNAEDERSIHETDLPAEKQLVLLLHASTQRTRLERSFTARRELKQLQKERCAHSKPQPRPAPSVQAESKAPHPSYVMSEGTEAHARWPRTSVESRAGRAAIPEQSLPIWLVVSQLVAFYASQVSAGADAALSVEFANGEVPRF